MSYENPDALVTTDWLADRLDAPDVRIVDASWHMPSAGRNARAEFDETRIPGAVYFDIDEIKDAENPLPHMLPSPEKFSARMRAMGLGDGNRVVVYDSTGVSAAARVWWMFRVFGHADVAVLDGGLQKWLAEERPVTGAPGEVRERQFTARVNTLLARDYAQMRANVDSRAEQVLDARSPGRFNATDPEPRAELPGGHIPGSLNLPFPKVMDFANKTMLPAEGIRGAFEDAGVDLSRPMVTSCGSGVTAAILTLALYLIGHEQVALFDGSWTEWAGHPDSPIET